MRAEDDFRALGEHMFYESNKIPASNEPSVTSDLLQNTTEFVLRNNFCMPQN